MSQKQGLKKKVSNLIYKVLTETLSAREAILEIPMDTNDLSIKAAYHALVHHDADEDLRKRDVEYKIVQDEYLEFIAETLAKGDDLPMNIINNYEKFYNDEVDTKLDLSRFRGVLKKICKFLNV